MRCQSSHAGPSCSRHRRTSWNAGASKRYAITERAALKLEGTFTNVTNRVNLSDPQLNITNGSFGKITSARGVDFGGGRTGQVSLRLEF